MYCTYRRGVKIHTLTSIQFSLFVKTSYIHPVSRFLTYCLADRLYNNALSVSRVTAVDIV